uniref:Uncharacterized protein n=1 Tax=Utricularia reniformis TaxID=192314 RepID=A0A1Y0AZ36_9LAMI|nr:hypothetical protein AEK19_MT1775 [Utricularia reniformis]ART30407.1 hypothetical protein AEK19_MT1775 [Utricularia reniformis]
MVNRYFFLSYGIHVEELGWKRILHMHSFINLRFPLPVWTKTETSLMIRFDGSCSLALLLFLDALLMNFQTEAYYYLLC